MWQISEAPTMMDKLSNYIIVDIGANLTNKKFSRDLDAVIQRAREAGVTKIMVRKLSIEMLKISRVNPRVSGDGHQPPLHQGGAQTDQALPRHPVLHRRSVAVASPTWDWLIYISLGIHPHDAKSWDEETCSEIREAARCAECVAIGECGLDFNRNFSPPETQIEVFEKQVRLHQK